MKRLMLIPVTMLFMVISCSSVLNNPKALQAAQLAAQALTISDADVIAMTSEFMKTTDAENNIAPANSKYDQRLKSITSHFNKEQGIELNYKVYITPDINAFATADGSIRVYSGLMDIMSDDELVAIMGHEIGHVRNNDVKDAMKNAYLTAAATSAVGATSKTLASLSESQLAQLTNAVIGAQYSQKQELAADDYSFDFLIKYGYDRYAMAKALEKLDSVSGDNAAQTDYISSLFSSHPETQKRAKRMRDKADNYKAANGQTQNSQLQNKWSF